ncbi:hypothetical protein [Clostridium sp. M14]|uniref:hypothetical protein n=1 Tax=Clostridium sp. M14 TaxID=2716311 RepID=UPI0013EEDAF5|nr:hypothetical protein [Clostridium sp. M14]MBZ9693275.1 hypothetical protein [Clostridium sp. M14]
MKSNIFIPKKINVGFQERCDTYTKKLAYIIYFDEKGKLRKENSWNSWKDDSIPNEIYNNVPTEGFVLNKKVGDYCSDWNHRQAYVRVYDPREFEFEITIENLLYILENTSSIKGKGLEGQFIYGWDGKDLVLIPMHSPDYKEISEFNNILYNDETIKGKDLIVGAKYLTKQNEEWIYIGKYKYYDYDGAEKKGKYFWFAKKSKYSEDYHFKQIKNISNNKIIKTINDNCCDNYAEIFDSMESERCYSPYDEIKDAFKYYTFEEFKNRQEEDTYWDRAYYYDCNKEKRIQVYIKDGKDIELKEQKLVEKKYNCWWGDINSSYKDWETIFENKFGSLEEVYNHYKPQYINNYLQNGKFYRKEEA